MTGFSIRHAGHADAAALSAFAARTFRETFAAANTAEDMAAYLSATFSPARQAAELAEPGAVVLLAEVTPPPDEGPPPLAGYAHLVSGEPPASVPAEAAVELRRFYVAAEWQGRGLAQSLMRAAIEEAERRGARTLWLGVWEHNPRAIAFYRKSGFRIVGAQHFRLGSDLQRDVVMARELDRPHP